MSNFTYHLNLDQKLPTEEQWALIDKVFKQNDAKYILIDETQWTNILTKGKQKVQNMMIAAINKSSTRPKAILRIQLKNDKGLEDTFTFNSYYSHINVDGYTGNTTLKYSTETEHIELTLTYQAVCSPITSKHFYDMDLAHLTKIYKGQLMGQNINSSFQTVKSVANGYDDKALIDNQTNFIKRTAPTIQLLTLKSLDYLNNITNLKTQIESLLKLTKEECYAKYTNCDYYSRVKLETIKNNKKDFSAYYPIITYEQFQDIINQEIPKQEIDFTVFGLGSAGTGILDQVAHHSNMKSYLLADMDLVEEKNIRNQWYTIPNIHWHKTKASTTKINNIININMKPEFVKSNTFKNITVYETSLIKSYTCKFQEVPTELYKTKYLVSGFDSLKTRLELLQYVKDKKMETKYLIDTRYNDLEADIYFIDTENEKEIVYYEKNLLADAKAFREQQEAISKEELESNFIKALENNETFTSNCLQTRKIIRKELSDKTSKELTNKGLQFLKTCAASKCKNETCLNYWKILLETYPDKIIKTFNLYDIQESSCVKQNIIDIYKYASSYVFSALREIEDGNIKPFTHIEVTTENGLPTHLLRKK